MIAGIESFSGLKHIEEGSEDHPCNSENDSFLSALVMRTDFFLPVDWLFSGVRPAQQHKCLEEENSDISVPTLKMIVIAEARSTPGMVRSKEIRKFKEFYYFIDSTVNTVDESIHKDQMLARYSVIEVADLPNMPLTTA